MNCVLPVSLVAAALLCGCANRSDTLPGANPGDLLVTPEHSLVGRVLTYNLAGRFVVLDFPVGKLPPAEQVLFVYRQGLKVGEVKITGPERDTNTVADLLSGEAQRGDEVRER